MAFPLQLKVFPWTPAALSYQRGEKRKKQKNEVWGPTPEKSLFLLQRRLDEIYLPIDAGVRRFFPMEVTRR